MQIFQALEEYMENSKHLPMLPHALKKLIKTHYSTSTDPLKSLEAPKLIQYNKSTNLQSPKKDTSQPPFPKDAASHFIPDLPISNKQSQGALDEKNPACIPIVSNGKWMGVILTKDQNRTPSHITNKAPHVKEPTKGYPTNISPASPVSKPSALSEDNVKRVLHEVNTPLSIIKNYMHILGNKLSDQGIAQDETRIIKEEIDRISQLLGQLNPSPSKETATSEPVNINTQVVDLVKIMRKSLKEQSNIRINLDMDEQLPLLYAKKDSIKQILVNLIKNSIDAMPDGGHLNIRTRYIHPSDNNEHGTLQIPKRRLEIIISDTGKGIPTEIMPQIFDLYISSKKENHSGMGLSIVKGIVESLHGTITCTNNKDKGATFKITFPLHDAAVYNCEIPA